MKKFVWVALTSLFVISLVLASCQAATEEEEQEGTTITGEVTETEAEEDEEEEVVEEEAGPEMVTDVLGRRVPKPQYGGTITIRVLSNQIETLDPIVSNTNRLLETLQYSRLVHPDWLRGPQGTGEVPFSMNFHERDAYVGELAEEIEYIDLTTTIYHLRQDVHWQNLPPVNGRQVTAYDVMETVKRQRADPRHMHHKTRESIENWIARMEEEQPEKIAQWIAEFEEAGLDQVEDLVGSTGYYAADEFTIVQRYYDPYFLNFFGATWYAYWPHEVWETYGDLNDPKHQIGNGPFYIVDHVPASSLTFERNPDYWMMDPFHPQNQLPYIDRVMVLAIDDPTTYIAALQTHKLDHAKVTWDKGLTMIETNPELGWKQIPASSAELVYWRTDIPPFSDKLVRQAASMAVNQPEILKDYFGGRADLFNFPISPAFPSAFKPLEEMPEIVQEMFGYYPDKARQLLADAGYPNGFKTKLYVSSADSTSIDLSLLVQEYLSDIGISVEIETSEPTTFQSILNGRNYEHMLKYSAGVTRPVSTLSICHDGWRPNPTCASAPWNYSVVCDDVAKAARDVILRTPDPIERGKLFREESTRALEQAYELALPSPGSYVFWTPWLKMYSGEVADGPVEYTDFIRYLWIDQDLKYQMSGQRD